nr:biotin--[acetyl-CoA-carboxylase] ligase [Actinomycetota bacterium]
MLSAERVRSGLLATRFDDIRVLAEINSTNRAARRLADDGAPEGLVVIAEHQTAGRGRLGRSWDARPGTSVLMSVLLRPRLAMADLHLVSAAVALAGRTACSEVAGFRPDLKWPNDLLVGDA